MRIITGRAKGLKLKTPKGLSTRPTSDRIKESLFNVLNVIFKFDDKKILDLFAGTGALGLEAMSRGSAHAVFVDFQTTSIIRDNCINAHFINESEIIKLDIFKAITKFSAQDRKFDLIFCDPPYDKGLCEKTLIAVDKLNLLSSEGLFVAEHSAKESLESNISNLSIKLLRQIKYGNTTAIDIFQRRFIFNKRQYKCSGGGYNTNYH